MRNFAFYETYLLGPSLRQDQSPPNIEMELDSPEEKYSPSFNTNDISMTFPSIRILIIYEMYLPMLVFDLIKYANDLYDSQKIIFIFVLQISGTCRLYFKKTSITSLSNY